MKTTRTTNLRLPFSVELPKGAPLHRVGTLSVRAARAIACGAVLAATFLACDRGGANPSETAVAEAPAAPANAPAQGSNPQGSSPQAAAPQGAALGPAGQGPAGQADSLAAAPAAAGKPSYQEEGFDLTLEATGPFAVGKPAEARVVLHAKGGYKVNDQYPFKLTLSEAPGLEFPAKVVTRDAMTLEKKQGVMKVAFTPKAAGEHVLAGRFSFSVCTEERCLIEKRDLSLPVTAK